jgi:aquaporin Z
MVEIFTCVLMIPFVLALVAIVVHKTGAASGAAGHVLDSLPLLIARILTEGIGTFLLCFTVAETAGRDHMAALAIGTVLAVAVYGGGYISGGHYNPAVSLAAFLCGKISIMNCIINTAAQFAGAIGAAAFAWFLESPPNVDLGGKIGFPSVGENFGTQEAICVEAICTAFLCLVVLGSACSKANEGKDFYGYAIGMTVFACAISSGRISGGAFNPAVGIIGAVDGAYDDISTYIIGPYLGAVLAAFLYRTVSPGDVSGDNSVAGYSLKSKCVAELLGTFFLTYTVATCDGNKFLAAFAIGTSLATSIYGLGFVSGGHFNPAVTVGVFVHKITTKDSNNDPKELLFYIISQVIGACLATFLVSHFLDISVGMPAAGHYTKHETYSTFAVIIAEVIATGTLVYTVLNCCFSSQAGNNYFGYAIGSVVFVMASAVGPISGGGFNPAVCTACFLVNSAFGTIWIYWAAPCAGGALAALVYKSTHLKFENHPAVTQGAVDTPLPSSTKDTAAGAGAGNGKTVLKQQKHKSAPPGAGGKAADDKKTPLADSKDADAKGDDKPEDEEKKKFKPVGTFLGYLLGAFGLVLSIFGIFVWLICTAFSFVLPCIAGPLGMMISFSLTVIKLPLWIAEKVADACPC